MSIVAHLPPPIPPTKLPSFSQTQDKQTHTQNVCTMCLVNYYSNYYD